MLSFRSITRRTLKRSVSKLYVCEGRGVKSEFLFKSSIQALHLVIKLSPIE